MAKTRIFHAELVDLWRVVTKQSSGDRKVFIKSATSTSAIKCVRLDH
jgi:hypothetical protein